MGCIAEMGPGECQQLFISAGGVIDGHGFQAPQERRLVNAQVLLQKMAQVALELWPAMSRSWRWLSRCPQPHSPWGINAALWISSPSSHHRRAPLWSRWISSRRACSPRAAWVVMASGWSGVMPACCNQWRSRRIPSPSRWVRCGPEAARRNSTSPRWRQAAPAMIPPHRCAGCAGSGDQTAPAMFVDADASSPQGSKEPSSSVWMAIRARCSRSAGRCSTASPL